MYLSLFPAISIFVMHFNRRLLASTLLGLVLVVLTACGGGGGGGSGIASSNGLATNAMRVTVDAGPAGTGYNVNRLYADVTICQAGNSTGKNICFPFTS